MRCPKCGVEYPENSDRCINCGNPINMNSEINNSEKNIQENNLLEKSVDGEEVKKAYMAFKLLGLIGIIFFLPLAVVSGLYLITRKEKDAKYWGFAFVISGVVLWVIGVIMIYTMGFDKFMATYNLTDYSNNLTSYGFKY
ncbi:MAG: hypothetical protein HVN35_07090 [Methanobacteriaceae archaeon]|nr:hypothetical protein [Methanobacteriaceae archaeon]